MNRWRIGSLGTTDVFLHPAMLLYALYALLTGNGPFMLASTLSILLHEGAHAAAAIMFGQPPHSVELMPLGAVMRLEDEHKLPPVKCGVMLLAGPAMTLLLCIASISLTKHGILSAMHGRILFMSNLSILLLNLLPALPLDGGRMLTLLLRLFLPIHQVHQVMRCVGSMLGISMIALNVYASWKLGGWNLSLAFAGCCLIYSAATATTTHAIAEMLYFMDRKIQLERKGSMPSCVYSVSHTAPVRTVLQKLPPGRCAVYLCVEAGSMQYLGWMTEFEMVQQYLSKPGVTIGEAVRNASNQRYSCQN